MQDSLNQCTPIQLAEALIGCMAVMLFAPDIANAAVTFGNIGQNVAESAKGVAKGVQFVGFAGGLTMAVLGVTDLYKASKGNGQHTYQAGIIKVLAGGFALGIGAFLASGSATLFGSDQTSGMGDLGL